MLFIPFGWFHFVFSQSPSPTSNMNIAISCFSDTKHCDCLLSTNPLHYQTDIPSYTSDHLSPQLLSIHSNSSLPFKMATSLHHTIGTSLSYSTLRNYLKNKLIPIQTSIDNMFVSNIIKDLDPDRSNTTYMTFDDFYNNGLKDCHYYLAQQRVEPFPLLRNIQFNQQYLWVNFGNVFSNLHYDNHDNILIQLHGQRKVILFPPSERNKLYLCNTINPSEICSHFGHDI